MQRPRCRGCGRGHGGTAVGGVGRVCAPGRGKPSPWARGVALCTPVGLARQTRGGDGDVRDGGEDRRWRWLDTAARLGKGPSFRLARAREESRARRAARFLVCALVGHGEALTVPAAPPLTAVEQRRRGSGHQGGQGPAFGVSARQLVAHARRGQGDDGGTRPPALAKARYGAYEVKAKGVASGSGSGTQEIGGSPRTI